MKRRMLASLLSLAILLGLMPPAPVYAAGGAPGTEAEGWFYRQLTPEARKIYDVLEAAYEAGELKDGKTSIDLNVDGDVVAAYIKGNRALFNDFAAAKDAFDLEHPEAWYIDSSKLALTAEGTTASVGTGYTDTYYVDGISESELNGMIDKLEGAIGDITASAAGTDAEKVRHVHDQIINSISYRFEYECSEGNAGYIRTAYALVTHEGVCEGYARSFQYALNKLGIPCVLIHGLQTSGTPEEHMWCAVMLDGAWYVVDPTWDDPVVVSETRSVSDGKGVDGGERDTYCLVGQDKVGSYWHPLGVVSTGGMEFGYPDIAPRSYGSGELEISDLKVVYDEGRMESSKSTVYQISYKGLGLAAAAKKGYYLLTKMYDINADGSENAIDEWYYVAHGLAALGPGVEGFDPVDFKNHGDEYYHDEAKYLVQAVSNCEYVAYAVTDIAPPDWKTPKDLLREDMDGYYTGGDDHILADTGLIYNPNGDYEQPPYVKNLSPNVTEPVYVGRTYTVHAEFTDPLFHPDEAAIEVSAALGKINEAASAMAEPVGIKLSGTTYSWGMNSKLPHEFAYKPDPQNIRWACETHPAGHTNFTGIDHTCRLTMLEFEFRASDMWADDSILYDFQLTGLVGIKSNKRLRPGSISFVFENMSAVCTYRCPRNGGIDWNLWGQPQLLDNPNNLNFDSIVVEGIDGKEQLLRDLYNTTHLDPYDMNGRLMLVVENVNTSQERGQALADILDEKANVDLYDKQSVLSSMLYEIDFARICSKTVVETGQSLRMQVGFPAGFDAGNLAGTVFKVYHFVKDDKDDPDRITRVEEVPVTVTPYGLVFVVSSFSPFAIVAVDAESALAGEVDNSRYVVLATEGHGKIVSDSADEANGTVKFTDSSKSYTFTIEPDSGYVLENITFTGLAQGKTVNYKDGKFTLSYDDIAGTNAIIGVSFAAGSQAKEVTVSDLCNHARTSKSTDEKYQAVPATCTSDGQTARIVCADCGQVISDSEVIPAAGHAYEFVPGEDPGDAEYKEPTCETPGSVLTCKVCGAESQSPALGHNYVKGACSICGNPEPCTIVFNANGGTLTGEASMTTDGNGRLASLPTPTRNGYTFDGWYTDKSGGTRISTGTTFTNDTTVYAHWTSNSGSTPSSPTPSSPSYQVTAPASANGTVTVTPTSAKSGDKVTITATPDDGYTTDSVTVTDGSGESVSVTDNGNGTYTFTMPASQVTVGVTFTAIEEEPWVNPFTDVSEDDWFYGGVAYAAQKSLMSGVGGGKFDPSGTTTRGMLVTILYNLEGWPPVTSGSTFTDVPAGKYYADAVVWAAANNIVAGYGNNTFGPDDEVTREQMAMILYNYARCKGYDVNGQADLSGYTDVGSVSGWALTAMCWANSENLIIGRTTTTLVPGGTASRAEAAILFTKFCKYIIGME